MAKGKKCPECGYTCYAEGEESQLQGTYVTYVCQNKTCPSYKRGYPWKEKVFESKIGLFEENSSNQYNLY